VTASANVSTLTQAELQPIVSEAIARWTNAGLDATAVAKLTQAQFVISDLPGSYLGEADGDVIYIDGNAAGHGWFVDPTPAVDAEFTASSSATQLQAVSPRAIDRMDLLTVVEHELGHELGLSDLASSVGDLMSRTLSVGVRRNATQSDAVFADHGSWL
jgi:predicted Zn-dependent protease